MRILVLGGTRFLGRHFVDVVLANGHDVTLFHRGQSGADLFPEQTHILGDRDGDLNNLGDDSWDAVVDMCGYVPRIVRASAEYLRSRVKRYMFISSISVYKDEATPGIDETGEVATIEDESIEEITGETYGALKALCEQAVQDIYGKDRCTIVRPGLIVGPHDPSGRFTYWPTRIAAGGEVLAPGKPEQPVQFIDVRDLVLWMLHLVEQSVSGVFNATGPDYELTMGPFLDSCVKVTESNTQFTWVDETFLLKNEVGAYMEMPLWVPEEALGMQAANCNRAFATGMTVRPVEETIRETREWDQSRSDEEKATDPAGMEADRERSLLRVWNER